MERLNRYVNDVKTGNVLTNKYIKQAVQRYEDDLLRDDIYFDGEKAERVIFFIEKLQHTKSPHSNLPFILSDWQVFLVANLYGWYRVDNQQRRFNEAYIEVARKNGKSALISALALYHLTYDGVAGGEIIMSANSAKQATICLNACKDFIRNFDPKKRYVRNYFSEIRHKRDSSKIIVTAANSDKLDGLNASVSIIDEFHESPNWDMYNIMKSSMGTREQAMTLIISTAGFNKHYPCYIHRNLCCDILNGSVSNDSLFIMIYGIDDEDDWMDHTNLIKANPNLYITAKYEKLVEDLTAAIHNPALETNYRTKHLNQWVSSSSVWIPDTIVQSCMQKVDLFDFKGSEMYVGVDLGETRDMTAASFMVIKEIDNIKKYYFKTYYFLPYTALEDGSENKHLYREWAKQGHLIITPLNITDYDFITTEILKYTNDFNIVKIGYDKANARRWSSQLVAEYNLPLEEFGQGIYNFSSFTKDISMLMANGQAIIDNNPITSWCFRNVVLKWDHNDNCKPMRPNQRQKIDGCIAIIQSLAMGTLYRIDNQDFDVCFL